MEVSLSPHSPPAPHGKGEAGWVRIEMFVGAACDESRRPSRRGLPWVQPKATRRMEHQRAATVWERGKARVVKRSALGEQSATSVELRTVDGWEPTAFPAPSRSRLLWERGRLSVGATQGAKPPSGRSNRMTMPRCPANPLPLGDVHSVIGRAAPILGMRAARPHPGFIGAAAPRCLTPHSSPFTSPCL